MDHQELLKIWEPIFEKLGYQESKGNSWIAETQELIIVLSLKVHIEEKNFYIDIGIIFKKLYDYSTLKVPALEYLDIGQGLYYILYLMGEWEYYLNNLFSYDPDTNTDDEIKNNISEIGMLFQTKVVPHIEDLDIYARLVKDFEKETAWIPFLKYFRPSLENNCSFNGMLEMYYWHNRKKL
jgi:hypothetical protein